MDRLKVTICRRGDRIKITTIFFVQINGTCEKVLVALKDIIDVVDNSDPKVLYSPLRSHCSKSGVIYFNSGPYSISVLALPRDESIPPGRRVEDTSRHHRGRP
jgi:hypothetical protein